MNILITICARGGSKGIPGKNIKIINGKPLIAYTINCANEFAKAFNANVTLSTDDEIIIQTAQQYGLKTQYFRPSKLGQDHIGKIEVLKDVLLYEENNHNTRYDVLLDLDVTSPLRNFNDLKKAYEIFVDDDKCLTVFSVNNANRNPYFNMVELDKNGYVHLSKDAGAFLTRQSTPKVYDLNASFYFYKREFFEEGFKTPITKKSKIFVMDHICFDLDHSIDFDFMEYLINTNKLDFDFKY